LYADTEAVLKKYPRLKIVLCHFYFLGANLERAAKLLDRYKNVSFDLAMGVEFVYQLSRRRDAARDFFIKYQDRILFASDIMGLRKVKEMVTRLWILRNFLESNEEFFTPRDADELLTRYTYPFRGLKLPTNVLRKIYRDNFLRRKKCGPRG